MLLPELLSVARTKYQALSLQFSEELFVGREYPIVSLYDLKQESDVFLHLLIADRFFLFSGRERDDIAVNHEGHALVVSTEIAEDFYTR